MLERRREGGIMRVRDGTRYYRYRRKEMDWSEQGKGGGIGGKSLLAQNKTDTIEVKGKTKGRSQRDTRAGRGEGRLGDLREWWKGKECPP